MLYTIANVNMKVSRIIVDVSCYDLRVGVVIALDMSTSSSLLSILVTLTETMAAVNSKRGIDTGLIGATLDFAIRKLT